MARKKKEGKWVCPKGCPITPNPCPHLEAELPSMEQGLNKHYLSYRDVEDSTESATTQEPWTVQKVNQFIRRLKGDGLIAEEIEILLERFINNKTFEAIAQEYEYVDRKAVHRLYTRALEKAELGYKSRNKGKQ